MTASTSENPPVKKRVLKWTRKSSKILLKGAKTKGITPFLAVCSAQRSKTCRVHYSLAPQTARNWMRLSRQYRQKNWGHPRLSLGPLCRPCIRALWLKICQKDIMRIIWTPALGLAVKRQKIKHRQGLSHRGETCTIGAEIEFSASILPKKTRNNDD